MADTQKFKNVRARPVVSFVVDDLGLGEGWQTRGVEIRGHAEALEGEEALLDRFDGAVIRVHADRVLAWGLD